MLEKKSYTVVCQEKNSISSGFEKKKILTQIKSPIPLLKKSNGRPLNR